jgi:hypothetical protein
LVGRGRLSPGGRVRDTGRALRSGDRNCHRGGAGWSRSRAVNRRLT